MAGHIAFTMDTDILIYFCQPRPPWERGSNENTDSRGRRNLPKNSDPSIYAAEDLEMIANNHKALNWRTPVDVMTNALPQTGKYHTQVTVIVAMAPRIHR
ncbi:hypothetical protein [Corynebacterium macginleyi]|uniref:hypothetical protein n=1 Tax=Corynebacterium macginleyi TaxID=38290 RepID=UPI001F31A901|nr:hypothetical protein [Corynebacterium macginleyi]